MRDLSILYLANLFFRFFFLVCLFAWLTASLLILPVLADHSSSSPSVLAYLLHLRLFCPLLLCQFCAAGCLGEVRVSQCVWIQPWGWRSVEWRILALLTTNVGVFGGYFIATGHTSLLEFSSVIYGHSVERAPTSSPLATVLIWNVQQLQSLYDVQWFPFCFTPILNV